MAPIPLCRPPGQALIADPDGGWRGRWKGRSQEGT